MTNRIWIELDKPKDDAHAETQCELANKLLKRMFGEDAYYKFWYAPSKKRYCLTTSVAGTFTELADRGQWFNLDYLADPENYND